MMRWRPFWILPQDLVTQSGVEGSRKAGVKADYP